MFDKFFVLKKKFYNFNIVCFILIIKETMPKITAKVCVLLTLWLVVPVFLPIRLCNAKRIGADINNGHIEQII